jgi:hypothetical protein
MVARARHPPLRVEPAVFVFGTDDFEWQDWNRVTRMRYRSRQDFVEFILTPEFAQDVDHKWDALSRSSSLAATLRILFYAFSRILGSAFGSHRPVNSSRRCEPPRYAGVRRPR